MFYRTSIRKSGLIALAVVMLLVGSAWSHAQAAALGHYYPAIFNNLDYFVPDPGFYYAQYTPYYNTDTYHDQNGNKVSNIGPGGAIKINAELHMITVAPVLMWVTPWKILDARYAAYVVPAMVNTSLSASLTNQTLGGTGTSQANYNWADPYFVPIWLGWSLSHWDFSFAEGFYAPWGKYDTTTATVGPFTGTIPSASNTGLGFWTNQMQPAVAWFPFDNKGTAVTGALTWEINSKMNGVDTTPGQRMTLNWGASQFLPLTKDQSRLIQVGFAAYDQWQITDDTGSASNTVKDQIHAVGGQLGFANVPSNFQINFKYMHEYNAVDRFQGDWFNLSFAVKAF